MKTPPTTVWTIKRIFGRGKPRIHIYYVDSTRHRAIENLKDNLSGRYTWRQLKAMGFSAIKVQIKEIK